MKGHPTGPATLKDLRLFGLTLGGAALVWAGILWWRGEPGAAKWLAGIGPTLALIALTVPAALRPLHKVWMPAARALAKAITWLILAVAYYLVITPFGLVMRRAGRDPLERKFEPARTSYWTKRERKPWDPEGMKRQY